MRIDRLDLIAYGCLSGISLNLSEGSSGLHLIYGDNEAGKSTSLRALIALLFGISERTADSYLHSKAQLRIGGKLRLSNGEFIEFVRRKGRKGTLLDSRGETALEIHVLNPYLQSIDENMFTKLYGIDHTSLVAGGQELLNQAGDLGQALFSAALGTANLRAVLSDLKSGAEELFKPKASTKLVNQAISNYKELQKKIKELSLSVPEWKKLQEDLAKTDAKLREVEECISDRSRAKSRLQRLNRVKGALAERRTVLARIEELGEVLLLPEDFEDRVKGTFGSLQNATKAKSRAESRLLRLEEESKAINIRIELLENEEIIASLYKELGAVEKIFTDRPLQDGKRRLLRDGAEQFLKRVRPDVGLGEVDQLRPLLNNKKWITSMAKKHGLLAQEHENASMTLRDAKGKLETIKKDLANCPEMKLDLRALKAAVALARKSGNLERRLTDARKRTSTENMTCASEFSKIGRFSGTLEAISSLSLPVSETLDTYEKVMDGIADVIRDHSRKEKELKQDLKKAERDLKALMLAGDVPTISELERSRSERNSGWGLIKGKYIEEIDVENEISEYTAGADLAFVYEHKVEISDQVSDSMRLAADEVVKRADLEAKIEGLKLDIQDISGEITRIEGERAEQEKIWNDIWQKLSITPGSPREMKQWILKVEKLLLSIRSARAAASDEKEIAQEYEAIREIISLHIMKFDESIKIKDLRLEAMLNLCEQRIEQEEEVIENRRKLEESLSETEIRIRNLQQELANIIEKQEIWRREWAKCIEGLGLKQDSDPELALEAFESLTSFFRNFDDSEELKKRIFGMDKVTERFNKKVMDFAESIGIDKNGQEATEISARLHRELNEAREARASLKGIKKQIDQVKGEIGDAETGIRIAREQLSSLRVMAGVDSDDVLEKAGELSKRKRENVQKLEALEQELMRNGDGLAIDKIEEEAGSSDMDAIQDELDKISSELMDLSASRDALRDSRQSLLKDIASKDGSAAAANASLESEQHLAAIVSGAESYLRMQIANLILSSRIEDYRKRNQAPVLARAGQLFSKITLGSFSSLRDEIDGSGKPVLLGIRSSKRQFNREENAEVSVNGMSDGTRDQLYLSLRLATLEQHLTKGEPMPFIVDDILIGFDDDRTRVCLEILAELSLSTQVLLFTHHRRVTELASGLKGGAGIFIHELL